MKDSVPTPVTGDAFSALLPRLNEAVGHELFDARTTQIEERPLSFYPQTTLLKATNRAAHPPLSMRFLKRGVSLRHLTHSRHPVLQENREGHLHLDETTVVDYIRFFMDVVRPEGPRFLLIETLSDLSLIDDLSPTKEKKILHHLGPPSVEKTDSGFAATCTVLYETTLYRARLDISEEGDIQISEESPLLKGLPVRNVAKR